MLFIVATLIGLIVLALLLVFGVRGAPYVPTDDETANKLLALAKTYNPKRMLDMGSGDGKLVIMMAQAGFDATGIEMNPILVRRSRRSIKKAGLSHKARIIQGDFWNHDVHEYDLVTLYAIKHIMPRLERKLSKELPNGSHILSNYFEFPTLKPIKKIDRILVYKT